MHQRRQTHDGLRLPRLSSKNVRRSSLPLVLLEDDTPKQTHSDCLPSINTQKNSTASQHSMLEICPHQTVSPTSSRKQLRSTVTTKESTENETDHDKASQLLSMSKQTADSIVAMMKILHRQLHAGEEYSDVEDDTQILDYPCKSILKSMNKKGQLLPSSPPTVRINPVVDMTQVTSYLGEGRGLTQDYNFSSEFNSVFAELKS
ncbi:hypothetical protein EB796_010641 [Bugula neritina]|uniref:Uncharacterized protein n=1 Tax=Bugula neritina TaxID=10212 RepID=A0A7J7K0C4_BUGNE|nr:hypothetical protein EB796_010641 [Bugula neritina]